MVDKLFLFIRYANPQEVSKWFGALFGRKLHASSILAFLICLVIRDDLNESVLEIVMPFLDRNCLLVVVAQR